MRHTMVIGPLILTLLLGDCSQPEAPRVATAGRGAPTTPASGAPSATPTTPSEREKGILFARCMTDHGVEVPDPVDGAAPIIKIAADGRVVILGGVPEGYPEHKAWQACRHLYPTTTYQRLEPKEAREYRAYARCMRDKGITAGLSEIDDNGVLATKNDAATRVGEGTGPTPEFMAAHRICRRHLSGGEDDPPPSDDPFK